MDEPDFDAAQTFLDQARKAHAAGDQTTFKAARRLVVVALAMEAGAPPRLHVRHLKDEAKPPA